MGKVIDLKTTTEEGHNLKARDGTVAVRTLLVDGRRMTKAFFRQIPPRALHEWPARRLGWVQDKGPWLIYVDDRGRLARAQIGSWYMRNVKTGGPDDARPVTDYEAQIYL